MTAPFESAVEYPDKRRLAYGKDKPVILINNGERGWQLDRYGMIRPRKRRLRMAASSAPLSPAINSWRNLTPAGSVPERSDLAKQTSKAGTER